MKVTETITITREVSASTGYGTFLAALENLALTHSQTCSPGRLAAASRRPHFSFLFLIFPHFGVYFYAD
jgi:hypothetical protein